MNFNQLKKNLKKDYTGLKPIKAALLGDTATQLLAMAIRGQGYEAGLDIEVYETDYDLIYETVINPAEKLYNNNYEYIFIFISTEKLQQAFYKLPLQNRKTFADEQQAYNVNLATIIAQYSKAKIIFFNYAEINDAVFGNFSAKTGFSFLHQIRKLNVLMQELAVEHKNIFIADVLSAVNKAGLTQATSAKWYITSQNVFQLDFLPTVAKLCTDMLLAFIGRFKKCLILDLDNTTWGGIIGDDGIENIEIGDLGIGKAFTALQYWAKELKQRGVLIAICSKNEEDVAKNVFINHPDMVLRLDDISIFVANWSNKGDNIRYIQEVLNIGMDSLVFIDDNPYERELVKTMLPEVTVPELPIDPADYLPYLQSLNLFETVSFTDEDTVRTKQYQEESKRVQLQQSFASVDEYLASLQMEAHIETINKFNLARCAQLTQRSNQFNLTTIRYTEEQLQQFVDDGGVAICISLKDKFGDNGLISLLLIEKNDDIATVNTWIMSCRVLKRGVEELAVNEMVKAATAMGCNTIQGKYLPTAKNAMVKSLYTNMGFTALHENDSALTIATFAPFKTFIQTINN